MEEVERTTIPPGQTKSHLDGIANIINLVDQLEEDDPDYDLRYQTGHRQLHDARLLFGSHLAAVPRVGTTRKLLEDRLAEAEDVLDRLSPRAKNYFDERETQEALKVYFTERLKTTPSVR